MLKKSLFTFLISLILFSTNTNAQTDSTDLDLYMTDAVLITALDSMLYNDDTYEQLNLDFTISDSVTFSKVHIDLQTVGAGYSLFKKVYTLADLSSESLLTGWDVSIPFGNLDASQSYIVAILVENYDGSLSATITKTLNP